MIGFLARYQVFEYTGRYVGTSTNRLKSGVPMRTMRLSIMSLFVGLSLATAACSQQRKPVATQQVPADSSHVGTQNGGDASSTSPTDSTSSTTLPPDTLPVEDLYPADPVSELDAGTSADETLPEAPATPAPAEPSSANPLGGLLGGGGSASFLASALPLAVNLLGGGAGGGLGSIMSLVGPMLSGGGAAPASGGAGSLIGMAVPLLSQLGGG